MQAIQQAATLDRLVGAIRSFFKEPDTDILNDMKAVATANEIAVVPKGSVLMNGERQFGSEAFTGENIYGRFYANVSLSDAKALETANELDARIVFQVSQEKLYEMALVHAEADDSILDKFKTFSEEKKAGAMRGMIRKMQHLPYKEMLRLYQTDPFTKTQDNEQIIEIEEVAVIPQVNTIQFNSEITEDIEETYFRPFGAWKSDGEDLTATERKNANIRAIELLTKPVADMTEEDREVLRKYSGFGKMKAEGERGVLYDYYTSPPVAKMGVQLLHQMMPLKPEMSILEPSCANGVFFDVLPHGIDCVGVELDERAAKAAQGIHGDKARIENSSFEAFNLSNTKDFDAVVGNAPFGKRGADTKFMDMPKQDSMDKYFLIRSLQKLKASGMMALIVHHGVFAGKDQAFRLSMLRYGVFKGAIRLPNESFQHTDTAVNPDYLFFQRHEPDVIKKLQFVGDDELGDVLESIGLYSQLWIEGAKAYYKARPKHYLGEEQKDWRGTAITVGSLSRRKMGQTVKEFKPEMYELNRDALNEISEQSSEKESEIAARSVSLSTEEAKDLQAGFLRSGRTKSENGSLYVLKKDFRWFRISDNPVVTQKIQDILLLSEKVKAIREGMQSGEPVDMMQSQAREMIVEFQEKHGSSMANDRDVKRVLAIHPELSGVYESLEMTVEDSILTKANIYDNNVGYYDGFPAEIKALLELRGQIEPVTEEAIKRRFPNEAEVLIKKMLANEDVFYNAESKGFILKEDFLIGDGYKLIEKINEQLEQSSEPYSSKIKKGLQVVQENMRTDTTESMDFSLRSNWIPRNVVEDFLTKKMENYGGKRHWKESKVKFMPDGELVIVGDGIGHSDIKMLNYFFKGEKQRSTSVDTEEYNAELEDEFRDYLAENADVRKQMEETYNKTFNNELKTPTKTYPIHIDGWNEKMPLRPHQWQSIHHLYRQGKGISALGVGFGKTSAAIGLFALLRQEKKAKRAFVQVPNNKVKDWKQEYNQFMPGLNVGVVDMDELRSPKARFAKYQEMANGNYDVLIFPESAATEIQLSAKVDERITGRIISGQMVGTKGTERKQQQKKDSLEKRAETRGRNTATVSFEDLNCDAIFADECHNYKSLFTSTKSREIADIKSGKQAARAISLLKKYEYLRDKNGKEFPNTYGLTATPMSNSPLEYYNMLAHVDPDALTSRGIHNIDQFVTEFAKTEVKMAPDWKNGEIKEKEVLTGFKNLHSLRRTFFGVTDYQYDPERIGLKKPKSEHQSHLIDPDKDQISVIRKIADQIEDYKRNPALYEGANYLTFFSKMRSASLDLELYDPVKFKGWKNPKLESLTQRCWDLFKQTGAGQVVFSDRVMDGSAAFNLHEKIKTSLIDKGFSAKDILIVNGITKSGGTQSESALESTVAKAIEDYNSGKAKILIGTTNTLGEGVNLQENSIAVHNFDIPYRPSDYVQRNGRVDRQGNKQSYVQLHNYMTTQTADGYAVATVQKKANWINKLLESDTNVFLNPNDGDFSDADGLLLALAEEQGDTSKRDALQAKIAAQKAEMLKKANEKKVVNQMTAYSRLYQANKKQAVGSSAYQSNLKRMEGIAKSLKNNPEFAYAKLLEPDAPDWIWDKKAKVALYPGAIVYYLGEAFSIDKIVPDGKRYKLWMGKEVTNSDYVTCFPEFKTKEDYERFLKSPDAFNALSENGKERYWTLERRRKDKAGEEYLHSKIDSFITLDVRTGAFTPYVGTKRLQEIGSALRKGMGAVDIDWDAIQPFLTDEQYQSLRRSAIDGFVRKIPVLKNIEVGEKINEFELSKSSTKMSRFDFSAIIEQLIELGFLKRIDDEHFTKA